MDESKDQILPFVDSEPNVKERIGRAVNIRKSMGIYGKEDRLVVVHGISLHYMLK